MRRLMEPDLHSSTMQSQNSACMRGACWTMSERVFLDRGEGSVEVLKGCYEAEAELEGSIVVVRLAL